MINFHLKMTTQAAVWERPREVESGIEAKKS